MLINCKRLTTLAISASAIVTFGAIPGAAPAQADPPPPWCGVPDPFGVVPGCQQPTPQPTPTPGADPAPTPTQPPAPRSQAPIPVRLHLFGPPGTVVNSLETVPPTDPVPKGTPVPIDRLVWVGPEIQTVSIKAVGEQHAGPGCAIYAGEPGSGERPDREVAYKQPGSSVVVCSVPRGG